MKTDLEPWKSNLEPWKTIKTNLNHWKPIKTEMEPWKTNLEPSKLTRSCRGWLWVVQVVTGDSQEEVMIFRYRQTDRHSVIIYISSFLLRTTLNPAHPWVGGCWWWRAGSSATPGRARTTSPGGESTLAFRPEGENHQQHQFLLQLFS